MTVGPGGRLFWIVVTDDTLLVSCQENKTLGFLVGFNSGHFIYFFNDQSQVTYGESLYQQIFEFWSHPLLTALDQWLKVGTGNKWNSNEIEQLLQFLCSVV